MVAPASMSHRVERLRLQGSQQPQQWDKKHHARAAIITPTVILALIFAALAPWISAMSPTTSVLLSMQIVVLSIGISQAIVTGLRPVTLVWSVFTFCWLCVGACYQLSHHVAAWGDTFITGQKTLLEHALTLNLLASMSFLCGTTVSARRKPREDLRQTTVTGRVKVAWAYAITGIILSPYAITKNGGLSGLFSSRAKRVANLASSGVSLNQSGGLEVALATILPGALAIATTHAFLWCIRGQGGFHRASVQMRAGFAVGIMLMTLYSNPFSNSRFIFVAGVGSVFFALAQPRSRKSGMILTVAMVVGLLGIYPLANAFRQGIGQTHTTASGTALTYNTGLNAFGGPDFDGFQQVANTIIYVDGHGFSDGSHFSSALLYFVPRSVWSGKQQPASITVSQNRDYNFTNLSLPVHAEMYLDTGLVGMVSLCFLLGFFARRLDDNWLANTPSAAYVTVPYIALAEFGIIRGPLGSLSPVWLTTAVLLWLATSVRRDGQEGRV